MSETHTDRDVSEMDHDELSNEWHDVVEALRTSIDDEGEHESLWDRRRELWNEMKSRVDAEAPECPECGGRRWGQEFGGPKSCMECDLHLGSRHQDLIQEVDKFWQRVQAGPKEAKA